MKKMVWVFIITKIGTIVIDLVFYHIFHNFQSDDRLRGRSLLRSRNLNHVNYCYKVYLNHIVWNFSCS